MTETKVAHDCGAVRWQPQMCAGCQSCEFHANHPIGLRFPGLSEECLTWRCRRSDCRGRVPVDSLEVWLDAAETFGGWEFVRFGSRNGYFFAVGMFPNMPKSWGAARLEAIQGAICKAVGAHEEEGDA